VVKATSEFHFLSRHNLLPEIVPFLKFFSFGQLFAFFREKTLLPVPRQGTSDPLPIGRVFGHTGEQQEDAVPSASRQDPVNSSRDQKCLPGKRHRHPHRPEVLQPTRQAKCFKRSGGVGTIAPLAVASSDEAAANACTIQGPNASKLVGYRGDAVVARRDAQVVGQGDHLG